MDTNIESCAICFYCCFSLFLILPKNCKEYLFTKNVLSIQISQNTGPDLNEATALEWMKIIAKVVKTHIYNPKICKYGNIALLFLGKNVSLDSQKPTNQRELDELKKLYEIHKKAKIQRLVKEGLIETTIREILIHIENPEVCVSCCSLITLFAETGGKHVKKLF